MNTTDVVIIGAGAAGLMCAIEAGKRGLRVTVLEKADKPGRKILISGGGRCNFTNLHTTPDNYLSDNPHFCKSALARYTPWHFIGLMSAHGLSYTEKTLGQLFCDQKAPAIVAMLLDECARAGVRIRCGEQVREIDWQDGRYTVKTADAHYRAANLVVATGGPSIPKMGATDFSQSVAKRFGLHTIPFRPALVPLVFSDQDKARWFAGLSGIALPVTASCNGVSFHENMLVTHRGLSGPAILQISSFWRKGDPLSIDLLPAHNAAELLNQAREQHPERHLHNWLSEYLPSRLAQRLCEVISLQGPLKQLSPRQLTNLAGLLNGWTLTPSGTEGMRTAEVSAGGVDCNELSSKTLAARKQPGLYFIGEAVDVTGHLGGFNFQWAWASGWCAGQALGL
ncbi:NAD(P)/FAD-dependent oxidoreductase [Granulosicoccaceae sp. 1_MG-2023]|nr:NAD(P)/FAD-dependent oxidoreductase [Granulosicoccaceae sp. 1_MG-2023]